MPGERPETVREQDEVLGVRLRRTDTPLTILGLMAWRSLWSMGKGAGASAFARSPVALAAAGHRVHVVQPRARGDADEDHYAGVHFHRFACPEVFSNARLPLPARLWERLWRYYAYQWIAPRQILRAAATIRPDVIVAYGIMTAPAARRVADRLHLPLVGRYFGNTLSLALHKRLSWQGNFMERTGFPTPVDAMILTNDGSPVLEVLRRLHVDLRPVHFWRNGIPEIFTPGPRPAELAARLELPDDAYVLMTVTRLHSEKRLDRVLHALAAVRRERPRTYAVLLGDGPEKAPLLDLAGRLGVRDALRLPGPVPNDELPPWYRLADVVLSLLDRTNASNPVFEAMACERCVAALDAGTTREIVRPEETGVLIPAGDEAAIARALIALARDPQRRISLGRRARPFILETCGSVAERMQREVDLIAEVAQRKGVVPGNLLGGQP